MRYLLLLSLALVCLVMACGDDDGGANGGPNGGSNGDSPTPSPRPISLTPPFEGPPRPPVSERTNFREEPGYELPGPGDVPAPDDTSDPVLSPTGDPECPDDWTRLLRPAEGFKICYPPDWSTAGTGYVYAPSQDRWFAAGLFDFTDDSRERQRVHVSVYVLPAYALPFLYTRDCPQAYSVTFAGEPAVVCADYPAVTPEARIISYHVLKDDLDYFVNIAQYFEYDADEGEYTDDVSGEAMDTALQVVGSFEFTGVPEPVPTATEAPASEAGTPTP